MTAAAVAVAAAALSTAAAAPAAPPPLAFRVYADVGQKIDAILWTGTSFLSVGNTSNTVWSAPAAGKPLTQVASMRATQGPAAQTRSWSRRDRLAPPGGRRCCPSTPATRAGRFSTRFWVIERDGSGFRQLTLRTTFRGRTYVLEQQQALVLR